MSITVSQLSKFYGAQKAVNDISFTVNKGEIVGFLGPNGAGKSTTMKMITGYLAPDAGKIEVAGIDAHTHPIELRKKIGYLPEANPLYTDMYIREYLYFVANIYKVKEPKQIIEELLTTVGITQEAHKKINELSKGYRQRVGLAAALVHNPEVLILDEPASGLDPNQIVEIRQVIKSLSANKTILFSSHIMQEVEAICDRVIIINKGNIVANDSLQNLQNINVANEQILVQFDSPTDQQVFEQLSGILSVKASSNYSFIIQCKDANQVKKELLQLSIEKNLNIVSLQTQTHSLETVFKTLTT